MILRLSSMVICYLILTAILWKKTADKPHTLSFRIGIGVIYGIFACFSTHFGADDHGMIIHVRDMAPLIAGMFFDPYSGIIAGCIGGIECFIAGQFFDIGAYSCVGGSIVTIFAGFLGAFLWKFIFQDQKPSPFYAFFIGAMIETFQMYTVFITHPENINKAFYAVRSGAVPMLLFCGMGLAFTTTLIRSLDGSFSNPFVLPKARNIQVSEQLQFWVSFFCIGLLFSNFVFDFSLQTGNALEDAGSEIRAITQDIDQSYKTLIKDGAGGLALLHYHMGDNGVFDIIRDNKKCFVGEHSGDELSKKDMLSIRDAVPDETFITEYFGVKTLSMTHILDDNTVLIVSVPLDEIYDSRNIAAYETVFGNILMFSMLYILVSVLVESIVSKRLRSVNNSLNKITNGNLSEEVSVYSSMELASLSDDINQMVMSLKKYIHATEKHMEQDLDLARSIQGSAMPHNFTFPWDDFHIYASMTPAKNVGGDFYDFFFVDYNTVALVIADVSGKGIPASLFMMRAKTAIRTVAEKGGAPEEILKAANIELCEGNAAKMFVTVWLGIIDLTTGIMKCANAGHEYPVLMRSGSDFDIYRDTHTPVLALVKKMKFKEYELHLQPGDRIFVYTDGIPEAVNDAGDAYGTERLVQALNAKKEEPLEIALPYIIEDIRAFASDAEQFDDITMLGFEYCGKND